MGVGQQPGSETARNIDGMAQDLLSAVSEAHAMEQSGAGGEGGTTRPRDDGWAGSPATAPRMGGDGDGQQRGAAPFAAEVGGTPTGSKLGKHPYTAYTQALLEEYLELLNRWNWQINAVRGVQVVLGVLAVVSSALVTLTAAAGTGDSLFWFPAQSVRLYSSFLAAITVGLLYGSGVGAKADRWRDGWRRLTLAWSLRQAEQISDAELILARDAAENMIGGVVITVERTDSKPHGK